MQVSALGYVRARAKDLGDWASYGPGLLGLQRVDKSRSTIAFRMDDRKQRIIVNGDGGEGIDRVAGEMNFSAIRLGHVNARVLGSGGNDDLTLNIFGVDNPDLLDALIDGGAGTDTAHYTANVLVIRCER